MRVFLALCAISLAPSLLSAQVLYGSLTGNVTDVSDAAIPGAKVEAVNNSTGITRDTLTDDRGAYAFRDLQPGLYTVNITAASFGKVKLESVEITTNTVRRADVKMQVAQVSESVSINAAMATLQTDRADVNVQLGQSQISSLPIAAGRNFQQIYKTIPGFSPPAEAHSDAGNPQRALVSNVNGVSYSNTNTRLDGATISYPWLPHIVAYVPPQDAVETVNIVTNSFDAEQGMAGGAAVNVAIKSGTNQFHGTAHEFHTNSVMKARNYFYCLYSCTGDPNRAPKNIFNQFGGTIGGPIKKNKLFFFADWERTTRRQVATAFRTLPTAALRTGNFAGTGAVLYDPTTGNADGSNRQLFAGGVIPTSRIDPAVVKMNALIPQPDIPGPTNNFLAGGVYEFNRQNADIKINYNPSSKSSVFGRYSISPALIFDPPSLGAAGGDALAGGQPGRAPSRIQSVGLGGTYTVSPTILVDGSAGFTRQRLGAENVDIDKNYGTDELNIPGTNGSDRLQGGYPRFAISGFSSLGNPNVSNPFLFRDNQWVFAGNVGVVRGSHSLRFGGEYTYYTINHFQPQAAFGPRGGFNFTGGLTAVRGGAAPNLYNGWGDWLLGLAQGMGKDVQYINPAAVRMPGYGFYARDNWQVNRKLTINYGMRYEYYPFATRDHRGVERYDPTLDKVLIGGLGNVPTDTGVDTGKGQIAPRFGMAYRLNDRTVLRAGYGISIDPNSFRAIRDAYPATISSQFSGPSSFQAAGSLRTGIPAVVGPDLSQGTIDLPLAVGTVTFPQVYNRGYIQSWNATLQREIFGGFTVQAGYVASRAIRQTAVVNLNASQQVGGGNAGRALFARTGRIANINQTQPFKTSQYDSLQTMLNKRMGSSSFGISYTWSTSMSYADNNDSGLTWQMVSMWERNRARASFDRPHNFQVYGNWELPFGKGKQFLQSGIGNVLAGGWQINGIMSRMSGTPFTIGTAGNSVDSPGNTQTADQVVSQVRIIGGHGRNESYFDPNAFAPVTAVRFGNTGRNILRGPGFFNLDASVFRTFKIVEKVSLQFRAEMFGATNTPQFSNPGTTVSAASRNPDGTVSVLNGYTEILGAGGERQARFALKVIF
ncbi:hypothetical protein F183_A03670 [Bryobacterales bacterium F-183]|nr:hypothetical protein F183_A03670 [Bryobacterales bacterium F-183]